MAGVVAAVVGIILWILLKKPTFNLELNTPPMMSSLSFGAGEMDALQPKGFFKRFKKKNTINLPEAIAREILETLGSVIF